MTREALVTSIREKQSFLCVGLDTDPQRIPHFLFDFEDPVFEFNKRIIDATAAHCVAYKPNLAFYESLGERGWIALKKTLDYIPDSHFTIADAKRGDIGNTARMYAKTFFETFDFDAVTIAPYMGRDSIEPFLDFAGKWVILLALTSNRGSQDFQFERGSDGLKLYERVVTTSMKWAGADQLMYVVGATQDAYISQLRELCPEHFFLVPGVGAQGGSLAAVHAAGSTPDVGLLVNSSRGIIYAGEGHDQPFVKVAAAAAALRSDMQKLL